MIRGTAHGGQKGASDSLDSELQLGDVLLAADLSPSPCLLFKDRVSCSPGYGAADALS